MAVKDITSPLQLADEIIRDLNLSLPAFKTAFKSKDGTSGLEWNYPLSQYQYLRVKIMTYCRLVGARKLPDTSQNIEAWRTGNGTVYEVGITDCGRDCLVRVRL